MQVQLVRLHRSSSRTSNLCLTVSQSYSGRQNWVWQLLPLHLSALNMFETFQVLNEAEKVTRILAMLGFFLQNVFGSLPTVSPRKSLGSNNEGGRMCRVIYIYTWEAYHIYDHFSQGLSLFLSQVDEDITVGVLKKFEGDGQVVVLKDRLVIVHDGQLWACVYQELVCQPGMVHVVDGRREDGWHHLQGREDTLKARFKFSAQYFVVTSSAGELRRTWVDCVTSAPWTLLWYGTSETMSRYKYSEETRQQYLVSSDPPECGGNSETLSPGSWKF